MEAYATSLIGPDGSCLDIRDQDLLDEVRLARGGFLFEQIVEHIAYRQRERDQARSLSDAQASRKAGMPRDRQRRDAIREVIETVPTGPETLQHIHSVLALCGLPYRDPGTTRECLKEYGKNSLSIIADDSKTQ